MKEEAKQQRRAAYQKIKERRKAEAAELKRKQKAEPRRDPTAERKKKLEARYGRSGSAGEGQADATATPEEPRDPARDSLESLAGWMTRGSTAAN
jgi:hypothetical protein